MSGADILNTIEEFIPQSLTWPDFLGNQPARLQNWSNINTCTLQNIPSIVQFRIHYDR